MSSGADEHQPKIGKGDCPYCKANLNLETAHECPEVPKDILAVMDEPLFPELGVQCCGFDKNSLAAIIHTCLWNLPMPPITTSKIKRRLAHRIGQLRGTDMSTEQAHLEARKLFGGNARVEKIIDTAGRVMCEVMHVGNEYTTKSFRARTFEEALVKAREGKVGP